MAEFEIEIGADIEVEAEVEIEVEVEAGLEIEAEFDAEVEVEVECDAEVEIEVGMDVEVEIELDAPEVEIECDLVVEADLSAPMVEVEVGGSAQGGDNSHLKCLIFAIVAALGMIACIVLIFVLAHISTAMEIVLYCLGGLFACLSTLFCFCWKRAKSGGDAEVAFVADVECGGNVDVEIGLEIVGATLEVALEVEEPCYEVEIELDAPEVEIELEAEVEIEVGMDVEVEMEVEVEAEVEIEVEAEVEVEIEL